MKINEIQVGKTYWKQRTEMNGRTRQKIVYGIKVFVLQVDEKNQRVLGSLNGQPAEWFGKTIVARWHTTDPSTKTTY